MLLPRFLMPFLLISGFSAAHAATTANVTINGRIISSTCSVDINGVSDAVITLPPVSVSEFPKKGVQRKKIDFNINIKNCNDVAKDILRLNLSRVSPGASPHSLPNTGSAKNIEFSIIDRTNGTAMVNFTDALNTRMMPVSLLSDGSATIGMAVVYEAMDLPLKIGTVSSTMKVELDYK